MSNIMQIGAGIFKMRAFKRPGSIFWSHPVIFSPPIGVRNITKYSSVRATATCRMCRKFGEIRTCRFGDMRAGRQTDTQIQSRDRNTSHPYEVINV